MYLEETTPDDERRMVYDYLPAAIRDLATVRPDVVVFSCTSAAASIGPDAEQQLIDDLERRCQAPAISTNDSIRSALGRRQITNIALITPYVDDLTDRIAAGLRKTGIGVPQSYGMDIIDPFTIAAVTPTQIRTFIERHVAFGRIDGIFVSCTNLRAYETQATVESWANLPVVTSNQAALEAALATLPQSDPR